MVSGSSIGSRARQQLGEHPNIAPEIISLCGEGVQAQDAAIAGMNSILARGRFRSLRGRHH
jgi:hypothetical protein